MALAQNTAQVIRGISRISKHTVGYTALTVLVFAASVGALAALDLLPESKVTPTLTASRVEETETVATAPELPVRIEIPSIKLAVKIANPESTKVEVLDAALHDGVVRYPTSAELGTEGNVIVFGHSSYLPVVNNKAYKAFNEIQNLKVGDEIMIVGETRTYVYTVEGVRSADAGKDGIPLTVTGSKLTLATCDSFGTPSDRFIVSAGLVESYPNAS